MSSPKKTTKVAKRKKNAKEVECFSKPNNVAVGTLIEMKSSESETKISSETKEHQGDQSYIYRDFSRVSDDDFDVDYEIEQEGLMKAMEESTALAAAQTLQHSSPTLIYLAPPPPVIRASGWVRSQRFPVKLYAILSQPQLAPIITWMPHGRSWKVLKPRIFEVAVLPVFFESDNYHSFNRVINAWSFRRKSSGPDRGSYFHELFLRGKPQLQSYMRRLPRTHKKLIMKKDEEPDFFKLEKSSPLPTLQEAKADLELRKMKHVQTQIQRDATVALHQSLMLPQGGIRSQNSLLPPGFSPR